MMPTTTTTTVTLADLAAELFQPTEHISINTAAPGGRFSSRIIPITEIPRDLPQDRNVWFSVNPVHPGVQGRGTVEDATRWAALYADLDVKPGALPSMGAAENVVANLMWMLDVSPTVTIYSGHGLQPAWQVDPEDPAADLTDPRNRENAIALMRRWGRLVNRVAADHGATTVDSVFDLARILRAPGTINWKGDPVPATAVAAGGRPLTVAEIAEVLDAYGVPELPEDHDHLGDLVLAPSEWEFAATTCPYVKRMISGWQGDTPTARHPWLVSQATRLAAAHRHGCVTAADHAAAQETLVRRFHELLATGQARHAGPHEIREAFQWGAERVARKTDSQVAAELNDHTHQDLAEEFGIPRITPRGSQDASGAHEEVEDEFWCARPILAHLRTFARARMTSPWAVLGVTLARVATAVPFTVVLPPIIGSHASLNVFVGIVGRSGSGKGAAESAAEDAVELVEMLVKPLHGQGEGTPVMAPIMRAGVGSGEGLAHQYMRRTKDGLEWWDVHRARLFTISEIDTLTALDQRRGSTLLAELRKAWAGESLGFGYADPQKRLDMPRHSYRLALVVGIQPGRAGGLLDDSDGGTPQRFLWMPATDPTAPDDLPVEPKPWRWMMPPWPAASTSSGLSVIDVCDEAVEFIRANRRADLRGEVGALDAHGVLGRLKVAALLAILDGRTNVTPDDWTLAGMIDAKSKHTRDEVRRVLGEAASRSNRARAEAEAERTIVATEKVEKTTISRVAARVVKRLQGRGWVTAGDLRRETTSRDRKWLEAALEAAIDAGQLEGEPIPGQGMTGMHYRLREAQ